jgi:hypothetical protein
MIKEELKKREREWEGGTLLTTLYRYKFDLVKIYKQYTQQIENIARINYKNETKIRNQNTNDTKATLHKRSQLAFKCLFLEWIKVQVYGVSK